MHTHRYAAHCTWEGSTAEGYERYDRTHHVTTPPAEDQITLSGDPSFLGDGARMNPEQLLVAAASSCQLLSFLAVCARARVDVRSYEDEAEGLMPESDRPIRITRIVLRPTIVVAEGPSEERVRRLVNLAHEECYIANSLRTEVVVEADVRFA